MHSHVRIDIKGSTFLIFYRERIRRKYSVNQKQLGVLGGRGYCNGGKSIRMGYQLGSGWK